MKLLELKNIKQNIGDCTNNLFLINHNLSTEDISISIFEGKELVICDVEIRDLNNIIVRNSRYSRREFIKSCCYWIKGEKIMTLGEMSERLQKAFIEEFKTREIAENNLSVYEAEGEIIVGINNLKIPEDISLKEMEVMKELYAEYKIYTCIGHEVLAQIKQNDFYRVIESLKKRKIELRE